MNRSTINSTKAVSTGVLAVAMALSVSLTGTASASAASAVAAPAAAQPAGKAVSTSEAGQLRSAIRGTTEDGRKVRGSFTPTEFTVVDGVLNVTGDLQGRILGKGKPRAFDEEITTPVQAVNGQALDTSSARAAAAAPSAAAVGCDILNLDLGPLSLNVLGLQIDLQRVVLDIVAVPGPGNLLGNLLCAVAGLLDGGLGGLLGQLSDLLNRILAVLNR